jgi:hypothetical protein
MIKPKIVLLIFVSGKIVLTGAKVREEIYQAFEMIYPVLQGRFYRLPLLLTSVISANYYLRFPQGLNLRDLPVRRYGAPHCNQHAAKPVIFMAPITLVNYLYTTPITSTLGHYFTTRIISTKKNRLSCALKPTPQKGRRQQSHVSFFSRVCFSHITALHRRSRKGARNGTLKQGLFSLFLRHSPRRSPSRFISGAGALHPLERGHSSPIERLRHDGHARCGTKTKNSPSRWSARP